MNNDIISFFGASVTAQKTGFAPCLAKKMSNLKTYIYGYGGNHLSNAGICNIDDVLQNTPTYCFIDFFSSQYSDINELTLEYIDTIIYKFTISKCKLIFLFVLRSDHVRRIKFYDYVKEYLKSKNIYYIDINKYLIFNTDLIRDSVHTTEYGSEKYAEIIYTHFKNNMETITFPQEILETRFCNIKRLDVKKIFKQYVVLEGDCSIISFYMYIGTKSGIIEIYNKKISIWDEWCHYDRYSYRLDFPLVTSNSRINILQDDIDYSKCKKEMTYTGVKELNIIAIYYIGNTLQAHGE
jgi:hypothetical protein